MTAEERAEEECVNEGGVGRPEQQLQAQAEAERGAVELIPVLNVEEECVSVQEEGPTCEPVIAVGVVVEHDGDVKGTWHEEVNVEQTFTREEPIPYGPADSLHNDNVDEEECGFCLFMKSGPCGKRFQAWESCVDYAETAEVNIVEKCAQTTHYLKDCMEAHSAFYGPVLQAEKALLQQNSTDVS